MTTTPGSAPSASTAQPDGTGGGAAAATEDIRRVDVFGRAHGVFQHMVRLSEAAHGNLDAGLVALMEVRASQINHCAWCLQMHLDGAAAAGVDPNKLSLVAAFNETGELFSDRERAALALTESVTVITDGFVPDEVYGRAAALFDATEMAHLIAVIATINAFNRVSVASRRLPRMRP